MGEGKQGSHFEDLLSKPIPPTEEERKLARKKLMEEKPEEFLHLSEIIVGTRLLASGQVQCIVGTTNQLLLEISSTRINYEVHKLLMILEQNDKGKGNRLMRGSETLF